MGYGRSCKNLAVGDPEINPRVKTAIITYPEEDIMIG